MILAISEITKSIGIAFDIVCGLCLLLIFCIGFQDLIIEGNNKQKGDITILSVILALTLTNIFSAYVLIRS